MFLILFFSPKVLLCRYSFVEAGEIRMHIPDGFLDLWIAAIFYGLSAIVLTFAARRANDELNDTRVALLGVVSAGIFAAQMLNWPIPGGTSAHFVGGALAAIMLGPHLGALSIASVVTMQSLVFGDGGITALGANIWNMAIVEVYVGYFIYRVLRSYSESVAAFVAGWLGITLGAISAAIQLGFSSAFGYELITVLTIMGIGHLLLGLIEGAITVLVYQYIASARPDIVKEGLATAEVEA
jgi:cobalt/nickel transport system permease protein